MTDDSGPLNAALTTMAATSGGVLLPPGTYKIGSGTSVTFPSNVQLTFEEGAMIAGSVALAINGRVTAHPTQQIFGLFLNGTVSATGTSPPTVSPSGFANAAYSFSVVITTGGALGTAVFKYSVNGGTTYVTGITTPSNGMYAVPGTGVTIHFASGTYTAGGSPDTYTWSCTAASAITLTAASSSIFAKWFGAKGDGTTDDTAAINAAVSAAGTAGLVYFTVGNYNTTGTVTLGEGVGASFVNGAVLAPSAGTVTINGPIYAHELRQIFAVSGSGAVLPGPKSASRLSVKWWGAKGDSSTPDDAAFNAAVVAALASNVPLFVPNGTYSITQTVNVHTVLNGPSSFTMKGEGNGDSTGNSVMSSLLWNGALGGVVVDVKGTFGCLFEDLEINCNANASGTSGAVFGVWCHPTSSAIKFRRCTFVWPLPYPYALPNHTYSGGEICIPWHDNHHIWQVQSGGGTTHNYTNDFTGYPFPITGGAVVDGTTTVMDGTVTWKAIGPSGAGVVIGEEQGPGAGAEVDLCSFEHCTFNGRGDTITNPPLNTAASNCHGTPTGVRFQGGANVKDFHATYCIWNQVGRAWDLQGSGTFAFYFGGGLSSEVDFYASNNNVDITGYSCEGNPCCVMSPTGGNSDTSVTMTGCQIVTVQGSTLAVGANMGATIYGNMFLKCTNVQWNDETNFPTSFCRFVIDGMNVDLEKGGILSTGCLYTAAPYFPVYNTGQLTFVNNSPAYQDFGEYGSGSNITSINDLRTSNDGSFTPFPISGPRGGMLTSGEVQAQPRQFIYRPDNSGFQFNLDAAVVVADMGSLNGCCARLTIPFAALFANATTQRVKLGDIYPDARIVAVYVRCFTGFALAGGAPSVQVGYEDVFAGTFHDNAFLVNAAVTSPTILGGSSGDLGTALTTGIVQGAFPWLTDNPPASAKPLRLTAYFNGNGANLGNGTTTSLSAGSLDVLVQFEKL